MPAAVLLPASFGQNDSDEAPQLAAEAAKHVLSGSAVCSRNREQGATEKPAQLAQLSTQESEAEQYSTLVPSELLAQLRLVASRHVLSEPSSAILAGATAKPLQPLQLHTQVTEDGQNRLAAPVPLQ